MSKKKPSITTPNHKMTIRNSLTELMLYRSYQGKLPPYFWRDSRWKWEYGKEVQAVSKFIKKYGESIVSRVIISNYIKTARDYSNLEVLLQSEMDRLTRLSKTKDITKVEAETDEDLVDLRGPRHSSFKSTSLFKRLEEIERDLF